MLDRLMLQVATELDSGATEGVEINVSDLPHLTRVQGYFFKSTQTPQVYLYGYVVLKKNDTDLCFLAAV